MAPLSMCFDIVSSRYITVTTKKIPAIALNVYRFISLLKKTIQR